jgi:homoserine O-acetyltransferase/O-succinyltransferase
VAHLSGLLGAPSGAPNGPAPESRAPESRAPEGSDAWAALPPSGAWQPGDPEGDRRWVTVFADRPLALEAGGTLGPITVAYETWGTRRSDNAVLVLHALTGDSHLSGPAGPGHPSPGWWDPIVAPGGALDAEDWWVVCPNVLGGCQGTTGPASVAPDGRLWGSRFPVLTIRDQVNVELALADALGIERWAAVVGGSMGGMRALEWAVMAPDRVQRLVVIASGAAATAEQIALGATQLIAIHNDPGWAGGDYYDAAFGGGPTRGLGLARRIGQIAYRSELELESRFARRPQRGEDPLDGGRYEVESYLDHHAVKLARRFDANTYIALSRAMDHHDLGRDRGGIAAALGRITAAVTVAGVDSDRLYPLRLQQALAAGLPGPPELHVISSPSGHDGFLVEADQIDRVVAGAMH